MNKVFFQRIGFSSFSFKPFKRMTFLKDALAIKKNVKAPEQPKYLELELFLKEIEKVSYTRGSSNSFYNRQIYKVLLKN
jgi:hypothetical protein